MIEIKEIQMSNKKMMYKFIRFPHKLFKDVAPRSESGYVQCY